VLQPYRLRGEGASSTPAVGRGYFAAALQAALSGRSPFLVCLYIKSLFTGPHPHRQNLRKSAKSADNQIIVVVFVIVIDPTLPGALVLRTITITASAEYEYECDGLVSLTP
jgi:hypothetical protein